MVTTDSRGLLTIFLVSNMHDDEEKYSFVSTGFYYTSLSDPDRGSGS